MRLHMLVIALSVLLAQRSAVAQSVVDPSGHWEGSVQVPGSALYIEVDLMRDSQGLLVGTITQPAERLKGLPLVVSVQDRVVRFHARDDQPFSGMLSQDGLSIEGTLTAQGFNLPFSMARTGEPRIEVPVKSPAIGQEMTGTWRTTVDINGTARRLALTLTNHADGTVSGRLVNLDQGRLIIPVSVATQAGPQLTLDFYAIEGTFVGALNDDGTQLTGTYRQGTLSAPLAFQRQASAAN